VAFKCPSVVKQTYGMWFERPVALLDHGLNGYSGAYCAAVIISLLNLPLDLPRDSPAWSEKGATLLTNLPEYVARCK
jgi:hypothetical protein